MLEKNKVRNAETIAEQAERIGKLIGVEKIPRHECGYTGMGKEIRFDTQEDTYTLMDILVRIAENQAALMERVSNMEKGRSEPKPRKPRKPKKDA